MMKQRGFVWQINVHPQKNKFARLRKEYDSRVSKRRSLLKEHDQHFGHETQWNWGLPMKCDETSARHQELESEEKKPNDQTDYSCFFSRFWMMDELTRLFKWMIFEWSCWLDYSKPKIGKSQVPWWSCHETLPGMVSRLVLVHNFLDRDSSPGFCARSPFQLVAMIYRVYIYIYMYTNMYVYIYIYVHKYNK